MRILTIILLLSLSLILSGCKMTANKKIAEPAFESLIFKLQAVESQQHIFELTAETKSALSDYTKNADSKRDITEQLLSFIFDASRNTLNYQTGATLSANDTFVSQNANCLSLSIMSYSMARYLGIKAQFQEVDIPEYWSSLNGYSLLTGHVNIRLSNRLRNYQGHIEFDFSNDLVIDFNPDSRGQVFKTRIITKDLITAMFYNNKGANAMINKEYDLAYSYFVAAKQYAPDYSPIYGNLGVLFRLNQQFSNAEKAYQYALYLAPDNHTAMGNSAILYDLTNRQEKAKQLRAYLERKRKTNPYYFIAQGNEAYTRGHYQQAVNHFKQAIKLDKQIHESHFGLAKSYFQQGHHDKVEKALKKAKKYAIFESDKSRYQGKLSHLNAMRY